MAWIDTAKGIGIFLVVWGHFYASDTLKIMIYGFHMPLFLFLSGYLYKVKEIHFLPWLRKKSKQLLLPFFLFQALTLLVVNGLSLVASGELYESPITLLTQFFYLDGDVGFNSPLWFLVVLFNVELIFYLFNRFIKKGQWLFMLGMAVLSLVINTNEGTRIIFGLHIVPLSCLFFYLGFKCKEWDVANRKLWDRWWFIICGLMGYLFIVFHVNNGQIIGFRSNNLGMFFIFVVGALIGIFIFCSMCKKIGKSDLWGRFGRHSLFILGTHYFFLILYAHLIKMMTGELAQLSYPIWATLCLTIFAFVFYTIFFKGIRKLGMAQYFFIK
ncbi:acyltransferase family protein [Listeria grandensis]|uniref:acyltransferase family protein n=1 Tax=Listeria grandensis TaxID=1494963 RepID=UPI0019D36870|nr:acyltransferase family protein [Listeria grandensis]